MDNKNTKNKEKFIITASAVFVLTALTITGIYMNKVTEKPPVEESQEIGQNVDSTLVENPGRTGIVSEQAGENDLTATKSSNPLIAQQAEQVEIDQELAEDALSSMVEGMMYSFDGMNMVWPLPEGSNILIPYSMDKAVYFDTLDQYKYSPAIVIAAEVGTPVRAVSAGKITRRYWDYESGWTYEMDLGGGFKAYYGQLDYMQKAEDTYVVAGDVLGYIAPPTKYYAEEGSNLYFAMTKNSLPVSPQDYMEK